MISLTQILYGSFSPFHGISRVFSLECQNNKEVEKNFSFFIGSQIPFSVRFIQKNFIS
jgi:hypothetical protein